MGCCAQTNLNHNYTLNFDTQKTQDKDLSDKREVSGENFLRISTFHRNLGKELFLKREYGQAITEFSKAIHYCPHISINFSNRALCYKLQGEWDKCLMDSRQAVHLDGNNVKGLSLMAESLIMIQKKDFKNDASLKEAVQNFEKAYNLAVGKKEDFPFIAKELDLKLKRARKLLYLKSQDTMDMRKDEVFKFVENLFETHEKDENKKKELFGLFQELFQEKNKPTPEIPDFLNCKISYDIMKEPKITPDGISYEENVLKEHFLQMGNFDPVTRREIDSSMLLPNENLKKAIEHYYQKHPEHFESEKNNIQDIEI